MCIRDSLEEGQTQADFNVTGSAYNLGTTRVTARHPDLGEAVASITVADLPRVGLQVPHSAMLIGHPHRASVQLSHPAPAEGVEVQLTSTPEGRVVHPASVKVAAGETSREIQIQGTAAAVGAVLGLRQGLVRYRAALFIALIGVAAAPFGLMLAHRLPNTPLQLVFAGLLVYALSLIHI